MVEVTVVASARIRERGLNAVDENAVSNTNGARLGPEGAGRYRTGIVSERNTWRI